MNNFYFKILSNFWGSLHTGWLSPYKFGYNLGLSAQYHSINGFFQINHQAAFGKTQSGIIQRHQAILTIVLVSTQRQGGVVGVVEVYRQGNLLLLVARLGVVFSNISLASTRSSIGALSRL